MIGCALTRLKMNASKTEYILFGSKPQLTKCKSDSIKVVDDDIHKASVIKSVGVYLDEHLSFKTQIKEKCKIAFYNTRSIRSIRDFITVDMCKIFKQSKYSCATAALRELYWLPIRQRIKYKLACMVFRCVHDSVPSYLMDLLHIKHNARHVRFETKLYLEIPLLIAADFGMVFQ